MATNVAKNVINRNRVYGNTIFEYEKPLLDHLDRCESYFNPYILTTPDFFFTQDCHRSHALTVHESCATDVSVTPESQNQPLIEYKW